MFYLGLDLGQQQDHAAVAVVERVEEHVYGSAPQLQSLRAGFLARFPLGTPYSEIADKVRRMTLHQQLRGRCAVVADSTGVGAPVVEMLRDANLGCEISAVTITGGENERQNGSHSGVTKWSVPKQDLIGGVQLMLERGQLRIAKGLRDGGALVQELMDVRATVRPSGRMRMGADGSGEHDDLVIALALAVWRARRVQPMNGFGTQRLPGI